MNSPPSAQILSKCFWIVSGDRSGAARGFPHFLGKGFLEEAFQQLWDHNSVAWAGNFLDQCTVRSCGLASNQ